MASKNKDFLDKLSQVVTVIPQKYVGALLTLHGKLDDKKIKWIVNGDLAERLRLVKVDPDCIDIVTSKEGAEQIHQVVREFNPQKLGIRTSLIHRDAMVGNEKFPVYARSYYFEFKINEVVVKIQGDLQFKVGNWDWGEIFDFDPEYVYVAGKKIAVTPLPIQYEFYQNLGWADRAEKIARIIIPFALK
jgi:hypothetical protein